MPTLVVSSCAMSANSLHIELPSEKRPSLVPWLLMLVCVAVLLIQISQLATRIPQQLGLQAQNLIDPERFPDVFVIANGRQLDLEGTVNIDHSITPLLDQLRQIEGVRDVQAKVLVIDPAAQAREQAQKFSQSLADIDFSSVAFKPGSVAFTPDSDAALSRLLTLLQQYPQGRIRIEGHTDNTGADTVNLRVSRDRASAVANFLVARGISQEQLVVTGYGATQPIADNTTEIGRARNRRIEINPVK